MRREKAAVIVKSAFQAWESEYRCTDDDWSEEHKACEMAVKAITEESIPISYLTSRITEFRAKDTYANQFAADFLQAIINEYNKEKHNGKTE